MQSDAQAVNSRSNSGLAHNVRFAPSVNQTVAKSASPTLYQPTMCIGPMSRAAGPDAVYTSGSQFGNAVAVSAARATLTRLEEPGV